MNTTFACSFVAGIVLAACHSTAAEPTATITPQEPWHNVFGGQESVFHFTVHSPQAMKGTVAWQYATEGRTLMRGEQAVDVGPGQPSVVEVKLQVPAVKPGVIMATALAVSLSEQGSDKALSRVTKPVWIFAEDPFADRADWLKRLGLRLFDPEEHTADLFTRFKIPFETIRSPDNFPDIKDGLIIVGEGVSLKENRGLANMMVMAASAGIPVLCLAPKDGDMPLPGSMDSQQPVPTAILLTHEAIITQLDKRLDAHGWPPDGKMVSRRVAIQGDRMGVSLVTSDNESDWPWVDLRFGSDKGRLVICRFSIVEKWDNAPTPRFLLVKVLEHMTGGNQPKEQ